MAQPVVTMREQVAAGGRAALQRQNWTPYLFLVLPLTIYFIWVIGPTLYSFYLSVTNWDGLSPNPDFVGLANFRRLWNDRVFWTSLANNLKWLFVFVTIPPTIGLGLAVIFNQELPGTRLMKAGIFSPMVLSAVVIGVVWSWMYHPTDGLINSTLTSLGYDGKPIGWLANPRLVTWSILGAACWRQIGYAMLLYLAGLKNVDPSLVEASTVDGATKWQSFWYIILPLLTPITVVVLVVSVIDSLRAFDLVYIMTRGGPFYSSSVLANFMYIEAFNNYNMGYGAAIAVVLFLLSMAFIGLYLQRILQDEEELEY